MARKKHDQETMVGEEPVSIEDANRALENYSGTTDEMKGVRVDTEVIEPRISVDMALGEEGAAAGAEAELEALGDDAEDQRAGEAAAGAGDRAEVKKANFKRLANARVSRVIDGLTAVKKLASPSSYDWTDEQLEKIFGTIDEYVSTVKQAFVAAKRPKVKSEKKGHKQLSFEI
jgi:hypothetical protein